MRPLILCLSICFAACTFSFAQKERIAKGKVGFEFMAGYLNTSPVGVYARQLRNTIRTNEIITPGYSASLLPKSSAYVGILFDYHFHDIVSLGTGIVYTPKGWWLFEKNTLTNRRVKNFNTVDYF